MLQRFLDYIHQQHLLSPGQEVLLAVSGGRDSVAMLHLMQRSGLPFAVAHCNFHLRGADADRDQTFVSRLAEEAGAVFHTVDFDTRAYAAAHRQSIEEAARELRYNWFASLCQTHGYSALATAHHRDDATETFFLNLFRGTGISGLHGIRPRSEVFFGTPPVAITLVRPMLCFSRSDIDGYVSDNNLPFVEDYTNQELDARRNRIRLQLMPLLRELYPTVDDTMAANIERLYDAELMCRAHVKELASSLFSDYPSRIPTLPFSITALDVAHVPEPRSTTLFEMLRPYGFNASVVGDILRQLSTGDGGTTGRLFLSETHVAEVHRNRLLLAPQTQPVTPQWSATPLAPADLLATAYDGHHAIVVDADRLKFPLSVRLWQPGDRFVPFGMERHRLVSDFLKDLHLSRIEKQHVFLLVDANETPVWIIGLRPDNRCRISSATCHPQAISLII